MLKKKFLTELFRDVYFDMKQKSSKLYRYVRRKFSSTLHRKSIIKVFFLKK